MWNGSKCLTSIYYIHDLILTEAGCKMVSLCLLHLQLQDKYRKSNKKTGEIQYYLLYLWIWYKQCSGIGCIILIASSKLISDCKQLRSIVWLQLCKNVICLYCLCNYMNIWIEHSLIKDRIDTVNALLKLRMGFLRKVKHINQCSNLSHTASRYWRNT